MPIKNDTKRTQATIDEAVKRYMGGEQVSTLAKYYKVSRAGFYLWVRKYKEETLERSKKSGMTPHDAELSDKRTLVSEIQALKLENHKLRDKVVALMIKAGEI